MSLQLIKTDYILDLPLELQRMIFYFIPLEIFMKNETKLIKNIIAVYNVDHDPDLTKQAKLYYIKNIMSFSSYVFYTYYEDDYYGCDFGRKEYDTLELSSRVEYELEERKIKL